MRRTVTFFKALGLVAVLFTLGACTKYFKSDVSTFHTLSAPIAGKAALVPMNPDKQDSLEFRQYGAAIGYQLSQHGIREAGDDTPDYIIGFDVAIADGREKLENRPSSYGGAYWHGSYYWSSWGLYDPHFNYPYYNNELRARTVYHAELFVEIRTPDGTVVYEGRAETDARENSLPRIVPLLAEALFKNFPGPNGETQRVSLDLSKE